MNAIEEYRASKDELCDLVNYLLRMNREKEWIEFKLEKAFPLLLKNTSIHLNN